MKIKHFEFRPDPLEVDLLVAIKKLADEKIALGEYPRYMYRSDKQGLSYSQIVRHLLRHHINDLATLDELFYLDGIKDQFEKERENTKKSK